MQRIWMGLWVCLNGKTKRFLLFLGIGLVVVGLTAVGLWNVTQQGLKGDQALDTLGNMFQGLASFVGIILAGVAIAHDRLRDYQFGFLRIKDLLESYWQGQRSSKTRGFRENVEIPQTVWESVNLAMEFLLVSGAGAILALVVMLNWIRPVTQLSIYNGQLVYVASIISSVTIVYGFITMFLVIYDFIYSKSISVELGYLTMIDESTKALLSRAEQAEIAYSISAFISFASDMVSPPVTIDELQKMELVPVFILRTALNKGFGYQFFKQIVCQNPEAEQAADIVEISLYDSVLKRYYPRPTKDDRQDHYWDFVEQVAERRYFFAERKREQADAKVRSAAILQALVSYVCAHLPLVDCLPVQHIRKHLLDDRSQGACVVVESLLSSVSKCVLRKPPYDREVLLRDLVKALLLTVQQFPREIEMRAQAWDSFVSTLSCFMNQTPQQLYEVLRDWACTADHRAQKILLNALYETSRNEPTFSLQCVLAIYALARQDIVRDAADQTLRKVLDKQGPERELELVQSLLKSKDANVRLSAASVLVERHGKHDPVVLGKLFTCLLNDSDESVQRCVRSAIVSSDLLSVLEFDWAATNELGVGFAAAGFPLLVVKE